ncbi:MAG: purine-nucleoside phosphorylase [bacterium]|nr:purine-nucleoside phosphorylase [bacterium]
MSEMKALPPELQQLLAEVEPALAGLDVPAGTLGVILGSGLGTAAEKFPFVWSRTFAELGITGASVEGHVGRLSLAKGAGAHFLFLQGRIHRYEGHHDSKVLLPAAMMARLGLKGLLVTNAAGGLDPAYKAGDFMLIRDILSFQFDDPLRGLPGGGVRVPPRRPLFDAELSSSLLTAARANSVTMHEGTLNVATGPTYETRAEIRMSSDLGAQAASMSTFPECMMLAYLDIRVAAMSCITNEIREEIGEPLTHDEVVEVGLRAAEDFGRILGTWSELEG